MHADRTKNRTRQRHPLRWLAVLCVLLALAAVRGEQLLARAVLNRAKAQASSMASAVLHQAAEDVLSAMANEPLTAVTRDSSGCIRLIEANAGAVNRLSSCISAEAQKRLAALSAQPISIPLSTALGLSIAFGPAIPVETNTCGAVSSGVTSELTSAGVNQTRHVLRLHITCAVQVVTASSAAQAEASADVILAENIIVGEVPQTLLNNLGPLKLAP